MLSPVHQLTTTVGIVAIAAGAVAIVALCLCAALLVKLRRFQRDQRILLGDGSRDLVTHGAALQRQFEALYGYVQDAAANLNARMGEAEDRLDSAVAYRGLVRYDAYGEMSGRQATSIALLDAKRSGIIGSSIPHRDQARVYAKQIREGRGEIELSPEEDAAVRLALQGDSAERLAE